MDWLSAFTTDSHSDLFLTCTIIGLLILVPMFREVRARTFSVWQLKSGFLIYILVQFCVWPLMMYIPRNRQVFTLPLTFWTDRYGDFVKGQYCVIAGLVAFYLGYYRPPIPYDRVSRSRALDRFVPIADDRYLATFWGCVVVTTVAFAAMMASTGGVAYFIQNIDTLRTTEAAGWGVYLLPMMACQVGITLYTARAMEEGRSLALPALGTLLQIACSFVIGQRALMIAPILGFVLCYHIHVRPIRFTWRLGSGLTAFLAFNMWYGVFRGTGTVGLDILAETPADVFLLALFGRFHGGESMARVVAYTDRTGFNFFLPYVSDFIVQFLPRFLYPDKTTIGVVENVTFFPEVFTTADTGSAVPSLFGEMYWGLGIVAIVVVLYLHGRVFRRVQEDMARPSPMQTTIYWSFFVYALFANETLSYHIWALAFRMVVLVGIVALVRNDQARRSPVAAQA